MPNTKQYVDQSITSVQNTIASLHQALESTEKADNKSKIQSAIDSLDFATLQLSTYKD